MNLTIEVINLISDVKALKLEVEVLREALTRIGAQLDKSAPLETITATLPSEYEGIDTPVPIKRGPGRPPKNAATG